MGVLQQERLDVFRNILNKLEIGCLIIPPVLLMTSRAGWILLAERVQLFAFLYLNIGAINLKYTFKAGKE